MPIQTFDVITGAGTLAIGFSIVALVLFRIITGPNSTIINRIRSDALFIGFFLGLAAICGSLTYSEIYHLTPCLFCWWQRIFLYPQTIIFAVALYRHGRQSAAGYDIFHYSTPMAIISSIFSIYHIFLQKGILSSGACLQGGVSCAKIDVQVFGFLTMPMMALILGVGLSLLDRKSTRLNSSH